MSQPEPVRPYLQEKKSCIFYKLMVANIIQDKKLRIPDKFVQKFGNQLSSVARLTIPNGRIWLVELTKDKHRVWFGKGWHEFVEHCSIHVGYFLVFRYEGNSDFYVYIFDLATSEINYPWNDLSTSQELSHGKQCPLPLEKGLEEDNSVEKLADCPPCLTPSSLISNGFLPSTLNSIESLASCPPFLTPSSSISKVLDEGACYNLSKNSESVVCSENLHLTKGVLNFGAAYQSARDIPIQFNDSELTSTVDEVKFHFTGVTEGTTVGSGQRAEPRKLKVKAVFPPCTRRWRAVTAEETKRALRAAETFKSDNPFFRVILRPSYLYKALILHIPSTFARKYLNGFTGNITILDSDGKQWPARCVSKDGRVKLSKGWPEFARENNLDEGDVCVFELIKTIEVSFKVTIFRVLEDIGQLHQPSSMSRQDFPGTT